MPVLVLGEGSNLLVADAGFPGLVVRLGRRVRLGSRSRAPTVRAGAAAKLPVVARRSRRRRACTGSSGQWGCRDRSGGALRMNAGGHGSDIAAVLARCRVFDLTPVHGRRGTVRASLALGYRTLVAAAPGRSWCGPSSPSRPATRARAEQAVADIVRWRRENQPGGSNAGSVFVNPDGDSAGRLVEAAGLKGMRLGTAQVSAKHANFIQADEGGIGRRRVAA